MSLIDPDDPGLLRLIERYAPTDPAERAVYFEEYRIRRDHLRRVNARLGAVLKFTDPNLEP